MIDLLIADGALSAHTSITILEFIPEYHDRGHPAGTSQIFESNTHLQALNKVAPIILAS